jgi:hypothetical protein
MTRLSDGRSREQAHVTTIATVEQHIGREDGGANAGQEKRIWARIAAILPIDDRRPMLVPRLLVGKLSVDSMSREAHETALQA